MLSHTHRLKETFIPHIKAGRRDELSREKFGLCAVCVSMHMCVSLLKLADFVTGWSLTDRAREAEWQEGISIWNFNKDGKGSAGSRRAGVRGVSV